MPKAQLALCRDTDPNLKNVYFLMENASDRAGIYITDYITAPYSSCILHCLWFWHVYCSFSHILCNIWFTCLYWDIFASPIIARCCWCCSYCSCYSLTNKSLHSVESVNCCRLFLLTSMLSCMWVRSTSKLTPSFLFYPTYSTTVFQGLLVIAKNHNHLYFPTTESCCGVFRYSNGR